MNEHDLYNDIFKAREELSSLIKEHWQLYSNIDTIFFWINLATIIIPLIVWVILVDRKRIFEIAFFGFFIHVLWSMMGGFLTSNNYFIHPHILSYMLPPGIAATAVLFPIVFMLIYQYCTKHKRNFWFYSAISCFLFAYGYNLPLIAIDMVRLHKGMNLFYLSLINVVIIFISYGMTLLFWKIHLGQKSDS